jgi:peptidoglycan hydrolase-like protein with peptidoglycan-binding domain
VRGGSVTVLALAVVLAAWPAQACANPQNAGVQVALRALGLYCGAIDGDVGPITVAAIRSAQQHAGLPVTGIANARTRAALGPLGRPLFGARTIVAGDFGLDVSALQFMLLRAGLYHGALDGYLGSATDAAVRRFQRRARLGADGVVGPLTVAALVRRTGVPVQQPRPTVLASPAAAAPRVVYVVRPGDSLTAIAGHFGLSLTELAKANRFDPSQVLLIGRRLRIPAPALDPTPSDIRARLDAWSARLGVSASLVRALAWMESGYQPRVVSSVGAYGVMQTLPSTRRYVEDFLVGAPVPHTPDGDIEVGVLYLRHLLQEFGGDERLALAAWYEGADAVRKYGLYQVTVPFVEDVLALQARM